MKPPPILLHNGLVTRQRGYYGIYPRQYRSPNPKSQEFPWCQFARAVTAPPTMRRHTLVTIRGLRGRLPQVPKQVNATQHLLDLKWPCWGKTFQAASPLHKPVQGFRTKMAPLGHVSLVGDNGTNHASSAILPFTIAHNLLSMETDPIIDEAG
jgi:hypothetical protein